jgi:lysophospholipase L1-like esterase
VNGDSLAVGTQPYLKGALPGWRIRTSASVSRHATEAAPVLAGEGRLPGRIAISLGTNDDPRSLDSFRDSIRAVMRVAGDRCVAWADIVRPPAVGTTYAGYNRVLREESRRRWNLAVVDWSGLVRKNPGWLGPDGVHVSAEGYEARARAFARSLRDCTPGRPNVLSALPPELLDSIRREGLWAG